MGHIEFNLELFLEFRKWLDANRTELLAVIRKYNAIRNYIVTVSLGLMIFSLNEIIHNYSSVTWVLPMLILFTLLLFFSGSISEYFSLTSKLKHSPIYIYEKKISWMKDINKIIGDSNEILNDPNVYKAMKNSEKELIVIPVFFNAVISIVDTVREVDSVY
ncbi:hypothetical protein [Microbulbifer epialgicus]|uniref:SMODS and SLOG-associating 2TM effector domain-containing protein n=1 Tax=Microbulbifer epialgicus TaxID=393907 RepID=A0ABV4NTV8_9GAMM